MAMTVAGMIRTLSVSILLGVWALPVCAADAVKIGVVDQQSVMERTKAGKRALEDMKSYEVARQKILTADEEEIKDLEQSLQDPNGKLSEAAKLEKQEQFRNKLDAYQQRLQDFNREILAKQREMVTEFSRKIAGAAQAVAQKEGYLAILDRGNDAAIRIVIYHQPSLDVTDLVVKEFDRQNN
jgi:outer membrane protein